MVDIQLKETNWSSTNSSSSSSFSSSLMDLPNEPLIPNELLQSLKKHSLFQRTNNEGFIEKLSSCMHLRTYSPQDVIIVEGEQAKAMFFLLKGTLNVCSADFERIYATLEKGSCFGEIGILYSMPRTATVIASTKCIVATITAEEVKAILPDYPEVEKILRFEAEERLELLKKSKNTTERVAVTQNSFTEENVEEVSSARKLLQKLPCFKNCPEDFLHLISSKVEQRHYAQNDLIFKKGSEGKEMYFIINGTVEITNVDSVVPDPITPIENLGAGNYFGNVAVVLNTPRMADVRAVTPVHVYVLQKSDFFSALNGFLDLYEYFKVLAESTLTNLKSKAALVSKVDAERATANDDINDVIKPESVCSTTSDQDPTVPATKTNILKTTETRRRRGSVAVWSDPNLVALANRHIIKPQEEESSSKLKEEAMDVQVSATQGRDKSRLSALNEDVLSSILNQLDFISLIRFSTTSKRFYEFVKTSEKIIQTLDLSDINKRVTDDTLKRITTFTGDRVKQVNLSQCFYITDDGFKTFIENLPNVEMLNLNSCWLLTDKSVALLATSCPNLVKLDLSNCRKVSDIGLLKLLDEKATRGHSGLQSLLLPYCKKVSDMTMAYLAEFCSETLEELDIQRCTRISDQGFAKWTEKKFLNLKSVNLTDCSFLTDKAISYLVTAAPNITSLTLSFCCALSDSAIEGLMTLSHLKSLDASFCGAAVSDVSIPSLLNSLSANSMESLNLRGCVRITDTCIKSIIKRIQLKSLNISQCPGISSNAREFIKESGNVQNLIV